MGVNMKFKIYIIMLFLNCWLQASDFQLDTNTIDINQQLLQYAKLRDDNCKRILLSSVNALNDSCFDRAALKNIRNDLNKFCEDAKDTQDISTVLSTIKKHHQYGQHVSQSSLDKERQTLKKILNDKIDAENQKQQDLNPSSSVIIPTAPVEATMVHNTK